MVSCYDDTGEGRSDDPRVDGLTEQSKDDLERRAIEAVQLHRELLSNAEHLHRLWRNATAKNDDMDELGNLRAAYRKALFEARAQQMVLSMLVDQLGRVPTIAEDSVPAGGRIGRIGC